MTNSELARLRDETLAREVERTLCDYSVAWEGKPERVIDLGEAVVRNQHVVRLAFDPLMVDERLEAVIAQVEPGARRCLWIGGPSARPADLADRLTARGFRAVHAWDGFVLDDLGTPITGNPAVVIEPLSAANADAYAGRCTEADDPAVQAWLAEAARRFVAMADPQVQVVVARLDGEVAGYAVLRVEPNGTAYLRDAMTAPAFRRRGVYRALVAHRLNAARAAGCAIAVIQANADTSAPILLKRGFRKVCRLTGLQRP